MSDQKDNLITINVDGEDFQVESGANLIDACKKIGKEIPHYCYHPHLSVSGNCRMCLVEMGNPGRDRATGEPMLNEDGTPKIMWMPKPAIACASKTSPGLHVKTNSSTVKKCREGIMEFLLVNHPLDCPICDQAGECRLQEFSTDYGRGEGRYVEEKNVKPKRTKIGPRVTLDDERCILCSRCIRFSKEIANDGVLGFIDRGSYSTLTCFPGKELKNNYSLNTVDLCPVGALTSTDFRFKMRVWFLKETKSICTESSVGVNSTVSSREGNIYRITPRQNDEVNDTWMSDSGRLLYKQVNSDNRMTNFAKDGTPISKEEAVEGVVSLLKGEGVAFVGSAKASVEEQYLFNKIATEVSGEDKKSWLVARVEEGDGLLISADRNPNTRGALVTGLIKELPESQLKDLSALIDAGEIKTVFAHNECLIDAGLTEEQVKKINLIYLSSDVCHASQFAKYELPGLTVFEKEGSFINQQFRIQRFEVAVPGLAGAENDLDILTAILSDLSNSKLDASLASVWECINQNIPQLADLNVRTLPDTGALIDGSAFDNLSFPEGKSLHFEPKELV